MVSITANRKRSLSVAGRRAPVIVLMNGLRATKHAGRHRAAPAATAYGSHTPDCRFQTETVRSTEPGTPASTGRRTTAAHGTRPEARVTWSRTLQASSERSTAGTGQSGDHFESGIGLRTLLSKRYTGIAGDGHVAEHENHCCNHCPSGDGNAVCRRRTRCSFHPVHRLAVAGGAGGRGVARDVRYRDPRPRAGL